jgi:hypothetical protein
MTPNDHYERLYSDLGLNPKDAARQVFRTGWNAALDEFVSRLRQLPFGDDTLASFAVFIKEMKDE